MRIPFPIHIPLSRAVIFALILGLLELYQGTSPTFTICAFLFIVIACATFNLAGGFSRPSGSYVFAYAILVVIMGLFWKAVLWERADSNLLQPNLTMEIYLGSMVAMYGSVVVSRRLTSRRPLLGNLVTDANMQNATAGCLITGLAVLVIMATVQQTAGGLLSAVAQLNNFLPMALILGVIYEVRRSGGRSSVNLLVLIAAGSIFAAGILSFSKEGIFMPLACWAVAAGSVGYRLSRFQIIGLIFGTFLLVYYLVPFAQYGRSFRDNISIGNNVSAAIDMLGDLENVRVKYQQSSLDDQQGLGYYNSPQGFMDRLEMISRDDGLNDLTERRGPLGPFPLVLYVENMVPRFLWPGKPAANLGNFYAHEMGGLAADDLTTGISFSPTGEAYHIGGWFGIFVWAPLLWTLLFALFDSLCGDMRTSPWGLLAAARFSHTAPEGMLGGIFWELGFFAFALVFAALAAAYVMPLLGALVKGPERTTIRRIGPIRGVPGRATPGIGQ